MVGPVDVEDLVYGMSMLFGNGSKNYTFIILSGHDFDK
jgi:hypothetical protein